MKVEEGVDAESCAGKYSRDLLQRFSLCGGGGGTVEKKLSYKSPSEETEELSLSLGLSLGGRFGIEKGSKGLVRSASLVGAIPFVREDDQGSIVGWSGPYPSIIRTSSLPTEAEEEFRKRKECQSLRRLEAKRRRCEKQRKGGERDCGDVIEGQNLTRNFVDELKVLGNGRVPAVVVLPLPFGVPGSAAIAGQGLIGVGGVDEFGSRGKEGILGGVGGYGLVRFGMIGSYGSVEVEAHRGSSLGFGGGSDSDSRATQGSSTSNETKSPASNGLSPEMVFPATKPPFGTPKEGVRDILPRRDAPEIKPKAQGLSPMDNMPSVFTKGDGPDGIRVDGILYKYGKGEEIRIMCVCHGKFLSPAEFVKHAGGGDVVNPSRHIFVSTNAVLSR